MVSLNTHLANDSDISLWNSFVYENIGKPISIRDGGGLTPYHRYEWRHIISKTYNGWESFYIICIADDNEHSIGSSSKIVRGILPLFFLKKSSIPINKFISLPYCTHAGIFAIDSDAKNLLINKCLSLMHEHNISQANLRELVNSPDTSSDTNPTTGTQFITHILTLKNSIDHQWQSIGYNCRRAVKKALNNGLTIKRRLDGNALEIFYRIYLANMKKFGTPPHPKKMFELALSYFKNDATILIVTLPSGYPVGGMFLYKCGGVAHDPWVVTLQEYKNLHISDLLYWEAIRWAIENGCNAYDMGRSTTGSGVHHFKKKWGATDGPPQILYHINKKRKTP